MNISTHKNIILIIIVVLISFFGYWYFFISKKDSKNSQSSTSALTTQKPVDISSSDAQYNKEFVSSLLGLNTVNIKTSIFKSKVYQALNYPEVPFVVNYSKETGRSNPFLPIGVDGSNGVQNTGNTQSKNVSDTVLNTTSTSSTTTLNQNQNSSSTNNSTTTPKPSPRRF